MLRYKTETRPGLATLYSIRPANGVSLLLQPRILFPQSSSIHKKEAVQPSLRRSTSRKRLCPWLSDGQQQVHWTRCSSVLTARQSLLCAIASGADSAVNIINLIQQIFSFSGCQNTVIYPAISLQASGYY